MQKYILIFLGLFILSCASNSKHQNEIFEKRNPNAEETYQIRGYDETLLTGDEKGNLAILKVGDRWQKKALKSKASQAPVAVHFDKGRFHLLYGKGKFLTVDPEQGMIEKEISLPLKEARDFVFTADNHIFVSTGKMGAVKKIDLSTGLEKASIDLNSMKLGKGKIELHQMIQVGEDLIVQVARLKSVHKREQGALAVIDTKSLQLRKTIEIAVQDPKNASRASGIDPEFSMAIDDRRKMLLVAMKGERPVDTGMLVRIDLNSFEIFDFKKAQAGFQGAFVFQDPFSRLFMIYHTSTPTTSSHLFSNEVKEDGTIVATPKALIDAFDGQDAISINKKGTLVAMANTCITGVCVKGAGLSFVEVETNQVFPKLLDQEIGFQPAFVHFQK